MMKHRIRGYLLMAMAVCLSAPFCVQAQAPGEDPIVLNKQVSVQMLPLNQSKTSGQITYTSGMSASQQAKLTRYTAKAFSADTTGINTNSDVVNHVQTVSGKTECSQSVGSTTGGSTTASGAASSTAAAAAKGALGKDQVVVLRGDLVNICF